MAQNYGLGRGLASLIPPKPKKITAPNNDFNYFGTRAAGDPPKTQEAAVPTSASGNPEVLQVNISQIVPNPHQPRLNFDADRLKELSESIKAYGIIQPLVATQNGNQYEIIAGERRLQAAKLAELTTVPVILRDASEQEKLELAIIENIQRHDLNPIEEAKSYQKLADEFDLGQEEIGKKLGKSRPVVANKLRLLKLPVEVQRALIEEKITEGHAKALLAIENPEKQRALFELILKDNLTVRQVENKTKEVSVRTHKRNITIDPQIKSLGDSLSQTLGTKVKISKSGSGGKIVIEYYSQEELDNILSRINKIELP